MELTQMRYKNFIWPHNPRIYSIEYGRQMVSNKIPFGQYYLQDLGRTRRIMRGEGEFVGEQAYSQFGALATEFYSYGAGMLVHPLWQTANAYFVELKLEQIPQPNYVKYSFAFWEACASYEEELSLVEQQESASEQSSSGSLSKTHTVVKGESLWSIARYYGLDLSDLIAMNPQIKNPNLIYPEEKVVIG